MSTCGRLGPFSSVPLHWRAPVPIGVQIVYRSEGFRRVAIASLVLRPGSRFPFVVELESGSLAVELPVDLGAVAIDSAIPGKGFAAQGFEVGNAPVAKALAGINTDFDFGLIEPASMDGCVVDREPAPDFTADLFAEEVYQGLATMDIEIVEH